MFASEADLLATLARYDDLIRRCTAGEISFASFCDSYENFYWRFALDGHESDAEELRLLERHADRIAPHRLLAEEILAWLCSDEDAQGKEYVHAGRIGSVEALARLRELSRKARR